MSYVLLKIINTVNIGMAGREAMKNHPFFYSAMLHAESEAIQFENLV